MENYITADMKNVTLTVLEGEVYYERDNIQFKHSQSPLGAKLASGASTRVRVGIFHRVHTLGSRPACYMYTYINKTREESGEMLNDNLVIDNGDAATKVYNSPFPFLEDMATRFDRIGTTLGFIGNSLLNVFYNVPMVRRTRVY